MGGGAGGGRGWCGPHRLHAGMLMKIQDWVYIQWAVIQVEKNI